MSSGRRAYDLLRGYVNQEWERIRGVEGKDAEDELHEALRSNSVQFDRKTTSEPAPAPVDPDAWARKILGVSANAEFTEIRAAFERLNSRSDPSKFPAGSQEAAQASEIQQRVRKAYAILSEGVDTTEKRFRSLEID